MIPWAWWSDHEWIYANLLHQAWHGNMPNGTPVLKCLPRSLIKIGSWNNNCGAALEQVWAIQQDLAEDPRYRR